jgi:predicted DNA-binding ribbon-helix-helix protein
MYTQLDDLKHANLIKEYLEKNPQATRKDLSVALRLNYRRLIKLNTEGVIMLPNPIPFNQRNKPKTVRL